MVALLDKMAALNLNSLVFQIRPASDAVYNSSLEPWSRYLSGTEGKPPSPFYDPLHFVLSESHKRNIEVHAWFNPYRAYLDGWLAKKYPQYAHPIGGNSVVMDPGAKVVQDHVYKVFTDVTTRYDIDGVHMDDYFYPYPGAAVHFDDHITYDAYKEAGGKLSLADWRRDNVNTLIKRLSDMIHATKPWVKFGISPFGIWKAGHPPGITGLSSYDAIYADSRRWIREGWLDYLTPQLYWKIDPPQQSYTALLDWWLHQNPRHHHLYPGNAAYRVFDKSHWPVGEIQRQVEETRHRAAENSLGNVLFRMGSLHSSLYDLFHDNLYSKPALAPPMPWLHTNFSGPALPQHVVTGPSYITWSVDETGSVRSWAVYEWTGASWQLVKVMNKEIVYFTVPRHGKYAVRGVDRLSRESEEVVVVVSGNTSVIG